ncbi:MAG TPA: hypothetical protein VJ506_06250 [Candidatus Limnocylindrales bacterium]|nr:hypothetical protein [Candidatus Limnocylindrales bacterium]
MTETTGGVPGAAEPRCPWCSSVVPAAAERCPSCGAALREAAASAQDEIPGVTHVDPVLGMRRQLARPNRLVGWLADVDTEPAPTIDLAATAAFAAAGARALEGSGADSIAPPSDEVRREMQRLELEALKAELEERAADARVAAMDAGRDARAVAPGAEAEALAAAEEARAAHADTPAAASDAAPAAANPDGPAQSASANPLDAEAAPGG